MSAPEVLVADVGDPRSLAAMAARARVVLNLVGPYTKLRSPGDRGVRCGGLPLRRPDRRGSVRARDDRRVQRAGAPRLGQARQICGFEALPPDLMVALAAESARERWDEELGAVDLEVTIAPPPGLPHLSDGMSRAARSRACAGDHRDRGRGRGHRPGGADQRRGRRGGGAAARARSRSAPAAARAAR